ncbi:MAG: DUF167 domain-containing protein [Candidatus Pacebacteria bacterium]|nr:DUF167 domain-containing protein [Candidatus Paceibacterota bacterium]
MNRMKIFVKAKPGAKKAYVKEEDGGLFAEAAERRFTVAVTAPAAQGKANRAIERAIAEYFKIAPSRVRIVAGQVSRQKTVEILE